MIAASAAPSQPSSEGPHFAGGSENSSNNNEILPATPFVTTSDVIRHLNCALAELEMPTGSLMDSRRTAPEGATEDDSDPRTDAAGDDEESEDDELLEEERDRAAFPIPSSDNIKNNKPGFELQRKFADGSTRRVTESELQAADLDSKMQQAAVHLQSLAHDGEKWDWAQQQRTYGNHLFQNQQYLEAIDVYLTCLLVAAPQQQTNTAKAATQGDVHKADAITTIDSPATNNSFSISAQQRYHLFLQLVNNLAQSALQLAWYKKACQFCHMALEQQFKLGKDDASSNGSSMGTDDDSMAGGDTQLLFSKLYFKLGKAQRLRGNYKLSGTALQQALQLLDTCRKLWSTEVDNGSHARPSQAVLEASRRAVLQEQQFLARAAAYGRRNQHRQAQALKQVWGGGEERPNANTTLTVPTTGSPQHSPKSRAAQQSSIGAEGVEKANPVEARTKLYDDQTFQPRRRRTHSSLRAPQPNRQETPPPVSQPSASSQPDASQSSRLASYWRYYWSVVGRVAEQLLVWLGDEEYKSGNAGPSSTTVNSDRRSIKR